MTAQTSLQTPPSTPPNGQDGKQTPPQTPPPNETPATWETWLAAQPEAQRQQIETLHSTHTAGLKSALDSERQSRRDLEKQVKDLAKAEKDGSDAQQRLNSIATELETANRRADFYETASKPEIGLVDVKAAWVLTNAEADVYFDRKGSVNFELLKREHPSLFAQPRPTPRGNIGNGAGQGGQGSGADMNAIIRSAAGRT